MIACRARVESWQENFGKKRVKKMPITAKGKHVSAARADLIFSQVTGYVGDDH